MENFEPQGPSQGQPPYEDAIPDTAGSGRTKLLLIAGGCILAALLGLGWWMSGATRRQIERWGRDRNSSALLAFVRDNFPKAEEKPQVILAFQLLDANVGDGDLPSMEALFHQVSPGDDMALDILQIFQRRNQAFRDASKAVAWWIQRTPSGPLETGMRAMLGRMPIAQVRGAFLAEIGRRYLAGDKEAAIAAARRYAAAPPAPEAADLVSLLGSYADAERRVPSLRGKASDLGSDISAQEKRIAEYSFVTLTAFLVDRIPSIGDNVYEIGTFTWTGYSLQRNETAILTCNGTTFNTKGRFTMTVRPTGMKSFSRTNGGSVQLPTFEEVPSSDILAKAVAERALLNLYAQRGQVYREIAQLEETMAQSNQGIKVKLGWTGEQTSVPSEPVPSPEGSAPPTSPEETPKVAATPPSSAAIFDFSQMKVKYWPPMPPYPAEAKSARIQGTVLVEITINTEGIPQSSRSLEGPPQLREAAEAYALKWKFQPALANGKPTPATFKMSIPYKLK